MLPAVTLISQPDFDKKTFLTGVRQVLNRTITGPVDAAKESDNIHAATIVNLCELLKPNQNYYSAIRNPGSVLRHLMFSFMAVSLRDHCLEFSQHTTIYCHSVRSSSGMFFHLLSGTLEQWRLAIINCSSDVTEQDFRVLVNKCLLIFDQIGLKDLWFDFSRKQLNDGTIKLICK